MAADPKWHKFKVCVNVFRIFFLKCVKFLHWNGFGVNCKLLPVISYEKLVWRLLWCESVGQWSRSSWGFLGSRMWGGGNHVAFTAAVWALSLVIPSTQCLCSLLVLLTWSTLYVYVHQSMLGALGVWATTQYSQLLCGFWHWYAKFYTLWPAWWP